MDTGTIATPADGVERSAFGPTAGVVRVRVGGVTVASEAVAAELPVAIAYGAETHVVMMATPTDLEDLAIGFTLAEGIVDRAEEITDLIVADLDVGMRVAMTIPDHRMDGLAGRQRNLPGRSGCGLCGIASIEAALRELPAAPAGPVVAAEAILAAVGALPGRQPANRATGAVHAAAMADENGRLLLVREDVGRHNALDKLVGAAARAGIRPDGAFLVMTSRCSMELVQKAATAGFAMIVTISAPTSLAIELAQASGLTLAGFSRPDGFNLYAHPGRVRTAGPEEAR